MPYVQSLPEGATLLDIYKLDMEMGRPLIRYQQQLLRGPSPLSEGERELIAAYVSSLNACDFCYGLHSVIARKFGQEAATVEALAADGPVAAKHGKLAPLLDYARKLTTAPSRVTEKDLQPAKDAGWDDTAIYHTVAITGFFNFFNRLVEGMGLDIETVNVDAVSDALVDIGYEGRI